MFTNLVVNAVKYNHKTGKWIEIGLKCVDELSAAERPVANVTLYGRDDYGQLWVASTVGRGTTFYLTLLDSVT